MPFCKWLIGDSVLTRRMLLTKEPMGDHRAPDAAPLFDGLYDPRQKFKPDTLPKEPELVYFLREGLTPDFMLAMRFTTLYTSVLPTLIKFEHFKILAVIRHPLDVIASWQRMPQPLFAAGNPPGIARFWPELLTLAEASTDPLENFVQLYEMFLGRYHELRDHIDIVKFEDIIENPHRVASHARAQTLPEAAVARIEPRPNLRNKAQIAKLRDAVKKYGVFTKIYYPDI